jgi:hypothetical protein
MATEFLPRSGTLTCFVAVVAIFVLPDFPSNSDSWLSPLEKKLAEKRMAEDAGVLDQKDMEMDNAGAGVILISALTDWKVWFMALAYSAFVSLWGPCILTQIKKNRLHYHLIIFQRVLSYLDCNLGL